MKLNIVKDKAGKVIATYEKAQGNGPVHEIEVAENYLPDIEALYQQHSK